MRLISKIFTYMYLYIHNYTYHGIWYIHWGGEIMGIMVGSSLPCFLVDINFGMFYVCLGVAIYLFLRKSCLFCLYVCVRIIIWIERRGHRTATIKYYKKKKKSNQVSSRTQRLLSCLGMQRSSLLSLYLVLLCMLHVQARIYTILQTYISLNLKGRTDLLRLIANHELRYVL